MWTAAATDRSRPFLPTSASVSTRYSRPVSATFDTVIRGFGNNAGIEVPADVLDQLGAGKRPRVLVRVGEYQFSSTVGAMGGMSLISLSKAHRETSGLGAGQTVRVSLDVDDQPVEVTVPPELASALKAARLEQVFANLAPSRRKEYVRLVSEAKTELTRVRRLEKILNDLG